MSAGALEYFSVYARQVSLETEQAVEAAYAIGGRFHAFNILVIGWGVWMAAGKTEEKREKATMRPRYKEIVEGYVGGVQWVVHQPNAREALAGQPEEFQEAVEAASAISGWEPATRMLKRAWDAWRIARGLGAL